MLSSFLEDGGDVAEGILVVGRGVEGDADVAAVDVVGDGGLVLDDRLLRGEGGPVAVIGAAALRGGHLDDGGFRVLAVPLHEGTVRVDFFFDQFFGQRVPGVVGRDVEGPRLAGGVVLAGDVERIEPEPGGVLV